MKHSVSKATSNVAMLYRHGRKPSDTEIREAYRELVAAKIERSIIRSHVLGMPLDATRCSYLIELLETNSA